MGWWFEVAIIFLARKLLHKRSRQLIQTRNHTAISFMLENLAIVHGHLSSGEGPMTRLRMKVNYEGGIKSCFFKQVAMASRGRGCTMATGLKLAMSPYNTCPYNFGLQRGQMRGKINYNSFPAISVYDCTCVMKLDVSSRKASKEQITVNTTQYTQLSKLHSAKIDGVWEGTTLTTGHYESHHFLHDVDGTRRGFFNTKNCQRQKCSTPIF